MQSVQSLYRFASLIWFFFYYASTMRTQKESICAASSNIYLWFGGRTRTATFIEVMLTERVHQKNSKIISKITRSLYGIVSPVIHRTKRRMWVAIFCVCSCDQNISKNSLTPSAPMKARVLCCLGRSVGCDGQDAHCIVSKLSWSINRSDSFFYGFYFFKSK